MDLESAVGAALRGELCIIMETREEAQALVDVCKELGVSTQFLFVGEVPNKWTVCGPDDDDWKYHDLCFWSNQGTFERRTGIKQSVRCADLLPPMPDLSDVETLL